MAHEMLALGCSAHEAAYTAILWEDITEAEREAMTHRLHSKADAAWRKMHEVMYNQQLEYNRWLSDFLKEVEAMLANMRDSHDLQRLPESHAAHTPPAPTDPHGHLV